ncbi:non-specific serine/threonine protein kinase [Salvia divinorum]|uniref:Non-specific serine/threonine protein kinase n=1 Tax=Salvia divinorum TaxID=28513 RepID=A0ABD1HWA9_SALDI
MVLKSHGCTTIHLILLYFCVNAFASLADDTISGNQTLSGDQTIVSNGDNFVLGFFKPGKSSRHYIGIWFNKVPNQTVVWVANREIPVSDPNTAKLLISAGNLVLLNEFGSEIWSTSVNSTSVVNSSLAAVLRDDGNLVLSDGTGSNPRSGRILWQSFDNPVHTWLPGGKIAYDKITKRKQLLTSWKNEEDPAMGLFSLELDPNGSQYLIKWNGSQQYWTSGAWNGHIFSKVPEMRLTSYFNFSYVNNTNEAYFTYSMHNPATISRFIMDVSGQIKQLTIVNDNDWNLFWSQPREQCQVHDYCGGFGSCQNALPICSCLPGFRIRNESDWNLKDYSGGCVREMSLQCNSNGSNGRGDKFWTVTDVGLPVNDELLTVGSVEECESSCFNDCSCTAYAYDDGRGCSVWNGDLVNLQQLNAGDGNGKVIRIRLSASSQVFSASKNSKGSMIAKADVYSYGMMLFELVSGRRNSENSDDGTVKFFPSWAANAAVNGGDLLGLLDPVLDRNADVEQVLKICKIGCWCIQDDDNTRPSMGQVVQILEGLLDVNPPPIPRSLQVFVETQEHIVFFTDSSTDQSLQAKSNASSSASSNSMNCVLSSTG